VKGINVEEQMVPGDYTALVNLNIRTQMDTQSVTNRVGVYSRGLPFTVYEVYPEKNGIVWGRVSSNTGSGTSRYVGLRVTNQVKAKLEKAFETMISEAALVNAIVALTSAVRELAAATRDSGL
jgi:hypothetical protein